MLFMFLKKYTQDLSEKYALLLKSTNQLAEGHLDIPIEGDVGLFNPIQEELKRIQKGFKKAMKSLREMKKDDLIWTRKITAIIFAELPKTQETLCLEKEKNNRNRCYDIWHYVPCEYVKIGTEDNV